MESTREKPDINARSVKLSMKNYKEPIYERFERLVQEKERRLEKAREE